MKFTEVFNQKRLFFDGAMGTMLQSKGLPLGELPENWNLTHRDLIKEIHKSYLSAGANMIKTNTFGANQLKFSNVPELVGAGVAIAKEAVAENNGGFVALDIGPTGKLMKPMGELSFEEAYRLFAEIAEAGEEAGADCALIETMSDTMEMKAAVLAVKENTRLPVLVTMIFDENGRLLTGADIASAVAMLEGLRVDGIGFNCGLGPKQMINLVKELLRHSSTPIIINPNAGLPVSVDGKTVFNVSPEEFASDMRQLAEEGAAALGGCCGTTPAHIAAMTRACADLPVLALEKKERTIVCSYAKAVELGERPVLIGERINPTGKARFKQALRENDMDYILKEGLTQTEKGAHILDVNVGLPEIDEPAMMVSAVTALQSVTDAPLQIDTTDPAAMEQALRIYNGKAMINSVNGKEESMRTVFPLAAKYGGVIVALTLDEDGIPTTAEGRIRIAQKIAATAASYGIDKKDLIIDALAMTISTDKDSAKVTLDTLDYIRHHMGIHTVLGVSNISFGLPRRELINSAFFLLAMERGLSAGIVNPVNEDMMRAYHSYCALKGLDENCVAYVAHYGGTASATATDTSKAAGILPLEQAILKGLKEDAYHAAEKMLAELEPLEIINRHLVPALDIVGKGFEENRIFLPGLLMSAEAAKSGFDAIKDHLSKTGRSAGKGPKIVLATVYGDIHDIGKNIVKVLLENYGYDVIDLGKDVPPQLVVDTVLAQDVKLLGLSALMTTTVSSMEETICLLHASGSKCKVMVGGAVLTEEYAHRIHADFYGKDAMASVNFAQQLFQKK